MRIIGGKYRGTRLADFRGTDTRPLLDKARQAVFNILGPSVAGARVADLFCGTGSFGLEALSRGALSCEFVDLGRGALETLGRNLQKLRIGEDEARRQRGCVFRHVERRDPTSGLLDLVFLDPPYSLLREDKGRGRLAELLVSEALARNLAEEATVLLHVEREAGFVVPTGRLQVQDERIYGRSTLVFLGAESDRIPGQDPPPPSR